MMLTILIQQDNILDYNYITYNIVICLDASLFLRFSRKSIIK